MTEVAIPTTASDVALPAAQSGTEATMSLVGWATELNAAHQLAKMICNTAFVPQHFRGKPEETAVAMLYGHTLELPPMVAVKAIYVVHGTPALYAQTMYAIAISKGHQIERVYADDERVEFRARRKGQTGWQKVEWTIERARKAKYTSNNKYQENPIGMLTEKCKAEAAKLVAPDALAGLYSVEEIELGDYEPSEPEQVDAPAAEDKPKRTVKRKGAPAPVLPSVVHEAPEPDPEPEPEVGADAEPIEEPSVDVETGEVQMCTDEQWTHLTVALKTSGYKTNQAMGRAVNEYLQRDTRGPQDITADEAYAMTEHFTDMVTAG